MKNDSINKLEHNAKNMLGPEFLTNLYNILFMIYLATVARVFVDAFNQLLVLVT